MSKIKKNKGPVLDYFSQAELALRKELREHPLLLTKLETFASDDTGGRIGEIAAYVNVAMDGMYDMDSLENLYPILVHKLQEKRKIVIKGSLH